MARDTTDQTPIESVSELTEYLDAGSKPKDSFRIGTEHEKFAFFRADNSPVPYFGDASISALLKGMREKLGWDEIIDAGHVIGLAEPSGMGAISIEPGGQFELSGAPVETIHQTCKESNQHLATVREVAEPMGIRFLGVGGSPKWTLAETPRMPKSRYDIMTRYMPKVGSKGLDMMYRTCTIQVNLDFSSEADMRQKMRVSMKLQSLATALFAASPFTEGKPNGLSSWRGDIWRDTDNNRSGLLPFTFGDDFRFEHYVEWALDVPMYFIVRDGSYHDCTHVTFRQFMNGALKGEVASWEPTMGDWTNHLSTLFPDVRLKRFLEMRGADGGPWRRICALPAFWVGLLYDDAALSAADEMTKGWGFDEVETLRNAVPVQGLTASFGGRSLLDIARDVVSISRAGLKSRARLNSEGQDESLFLAPLEEVLANKATLSDDMLTRYNGRWNQSVEPVFDEYQY
ncbi:MULTISPECIES: glutamate--cysteine ligase [Rhizobium]|uniref:Glutamate--cysteine ligase n=1 Tax=Rhizobium rhododendri TaxID=2506430 RepID=A0ABY8IJN1_9HYPH|nr:MULTISPECIES: glutamate--cysteine ligase [Rhizobium]MBZ5760475.1 glutamate--cysteine ligase [Rhizobium sp. VS19-DR96]MBZ5766681.1 glutamate--cysteine ligase [Rhizobium sp. VS19-DR129.2]MBZ5773326.1 glutamate--cysteine ligase [Rhizobium sp. VS19-DRK62.2]MBZ5784310.1 glutamate--cysteine ligase [Rhizobium sp. VS19-DR121]MBZ5802670.1 glutamate--cysteine ligase [Rhizobium sp. VS19-DR181]